jgi:hypothetical protein
MLILHSIWHLYMYQYGWGDTLLQDYFTYFRKQFPWIFAVSQWSSSFSQLSINIMSCWEKNVLIVTIWNDVCMLKRCKSEHRKLCLLGCINTVIICCFVNSIYQMIHSFIVDNYQLKIWPKTWLYHSEEN